jgi:hypothetical protein
VRLRNLLKCAASEGSVLRLILYLSPDYRGGSSIPAYYILFHNIFLIIPLYYYNLKVI